MTDYEWTPAMAEVSGFGGEYEEACREMVIAAAEWSEENPDADPEVGTPEGVFGLIVGMNGTGEELLEAVKSPVDGASGAMVHGASRSALYIHENGWDAYVEMMEETDD